MSMARTQHLGLRLGRRRCRPLGARRPRPIGTVRPGRPLGTSREGPALALTGTVGPRGSIAGTIRPGTSLPSVAATVVSVTSVAPITPGSAAATGERGDHRFEGPFRALDLDPLRLGAGTLRREHRQHGDALD